MDAKFGAFDEIEAAYKTVSGTPLETSILIPKNAQSRKIIQLAESHGAIIVTPNYRLIPESKGIDILDDVKDFWAWLHSSLPTEVGRARKGLSPQLSKVAVAGESAGGYLSLQSAFLFPEARISVVLAQYATLDIDSPFYNPPPPSPPSGHSIVNEYLAKLKSSSVRVSSPMPDRWDLCEAILAEGRHREFIGNEDKVRLMSTLEQAQNPPAIWLAQGDKDPIVPMATATNFVEQMKKTHPNTPFHLSVQPGSHGFDCMSTLDEEWVKEGCKFVERYWPPSDQKESMHPS
ncbi:hypothetical protein AtubIFM55763_003541 [Aspergillus tubingensis]|nr:hypothetical protein AtubIFM54640_002774 [Aspergillus tubingensis]GLA72659.1 hypothetical protein AtubIFM55763_003541 [Aspergillus tubingensis]GLB17439.1 hypothetical protein AtubIFM61612_007310 [Aspergillus tubingensis]